MCILFFSCNPSSCWLIVLKASQDRLAVNDFGATQILHSTNGNYAPNVFSGISVLPNRDDVITHTWIATDNVQFCSSLELS